jgi:hypothetical protein
VRRRFVAGLLAVAAVGPGCDRRSRQGPGADPSSEASESSERPDKRAPAASGPADAAMDAPQVHTDLAGLRHYIELPAGVTACRWIEKVRGDGILGPSDTFLTAFVELSPAGWAEVACDGGIPTEATDSLTVDPSVAGALLPVAFVSSLSRTPQGRVVVPGALLPRGCIQTASVLDVRSAHRVGAGLWIEAHTM